MNKTLLTAALVIGGATLFAGDVLRFRGENSQGLYPEEHTLYVRRPASLIALTIASRSISV